MTNFHRDHDNIAAKPFHMKEPGIGSEKIIRRKRDGKLEYQPDDLTIEEPLEIRIGRKSLATTMRTPGHDDELAAGFLVSEAIVRQRKEIAAIWRTREKIVGLKGDAGVKLKLGSPKRFGPISSSRGTKFLFPPGRDFNDDDVLASSRNRRDLFAFGEK